MRGEKRRPHIKHAPNKNKRLFTLLDLRGLERQILHSNCAPGNPRMTKERKRERGGGKTLAHTKNLVIVGDVGF